MRDDFAKVLVERPRLFGGKLRKGRALREGQPLPAKLGLKRGARERGGYKMLNENLAPLRRFLEKQVGRPWNAVHSEMRARIKPGNTVQEHILTHVPDILHLHVTRTPVEPWSPCGLRASPGRGWHTGRPLKVGELYVDPDDGIIKRARRKLKGPRRGEPGYVPPQPDPYGPRTFTLDEARAKLGAGTAAADDEPAEAGRL